MADEPTHMNGEHDFGIEHLIFAREALQTSSLQFQTSSDLPAWNPFPPNLPLATMDTIRHSHRQSSPSQLARSEEQLSEHAIVDILGRRYRSADASRLSPPPQIRRLYERSTRARFPDANTPLARIV